MVIELSNIIILYHIIMLNPYKCTNYCIYSEDLVYVVSLREGLEILDVVTIHNIMVST